MQYLDDIVELVEDLPEEMGRRFEQIRRWDTEVERLRLECSFISKRVFESNDIPVTEKERLAIDLGYKQSIMRQLTEKKLDLATRSERLMAAILEKVNESAYHCKIELEVDNPGCTEIIERHFCQSLGLRPTSSHLATCTMEFEPLEGSDSYSVKSEPEVSHSTISDRRPVGRPRNVYKDQLSKSQKFPSPSSLRSQPGHNLGKKYKKRKGKTGAGSSTAPLSAYMRRKQEKLREKTKMLEIHAARKEQERKKLVEPTLSTELDVAAFCASACSGNSELKREETVTPNAAEQEEMSWEGLDQLDSDDDFDPNEALDLFPSMLPSPPREIMESLKEDSLFGLDDDLSLGIVSNGSGTSPNPSSSSFPVVASPSPVHRTESSLPALSHGTLEFVPDKKKRNISFGSVSDTSLHGRPRKLTDRAVELLQHNREREKKRREDEISGDGEDRWCLCREGSSGQMICCDSTSCKYQWFHFDCVGLSVEPVGQWFCPESNIPHDLKLTREATVEHIFVVLNLP